MPARVLRFAVLTALSVVLTSCASSGVARPAAFPGAPALSLPSVPPPPTSTGGPSVTSEDALAIVESAVALQGTPYEIGGEDPRSGFDCSGLVRYVFEARRIDVPRTVDEQYHAGRKIALRDVQAGDLIFFSTVAPGASHVGIALGPDQPGMFVHAPGTGGAVRIESYESSYWRSRIVGARRIVGG